MCVEDRRIELRDGTTTVFLNASGEMEDVSPELKGFLEMVAGRESENRDDDFLRKLREELEKARKNQKWRREYMMGSIYERDAFLRGEEKGKTEGLREGRADGLREGRADGIREGKADGFREGATQGIRILRQTLLELGKSTEEIEEIIRTKYGTEFEGIIQEETEAYRAL